MNTKPDGLANSLKSLKLTQPDQASSLVPLTPLKSIDCQNIDDIDWKKINNIAELTEAIPSVCFYPGDATLKTPSILRCETWTCSVPRSLNFRKINTESKFKQQLLVDVWKIISHDEDVDNWYARDVSNCKEDFLMFVQDMINSIDARYNACVAEMCNTLLCLDFETILWKSMEWKAIYR